MSKLDFTQGNLSFNLNSLISMQSIRRSEQEILHSGWYIYVVEPKIGFMNERYNNH